MNTTALLVDILIIGVQVLIWVSGFAFSFILPYNSTENILEKSPGTFLFFTIVASYTLGIIFDYVFSLFFRLFRNKEEKALYSGGLIIKVLNNNKDIQQFLDNQYARLRIARATVLNLPLITISACCFICNNEAISSLIWSGTISGIIILGALLTFFAIVGWYRRKTDYLRYVKESNAIIE